MLLKSCNTHSAVVTHNVGLPQSTLLGPTLWFPFDDSLQFVDCKAIKNADNTTHHMFCCLKAMQLFNEPLFVSFEPPSISQAIIDNCSYWHRNCSYWYRNHCSILNCTKTKVMNISLQKELKINNSNHKGRTTNRLRAKYKISGCAH